LGRTADAPRASPCGREKRTLQSEWQIQVGVPWTRLLPERTTRTEAVFGQRWRQTSSSTASRSADTDEATEISISRAAGSGRTRSGCQRECSAGGQPRGWRRRRTRRARPAGTGLGLGLSRYRRAPAEGRVPGVGGSAEFGPPLNEPPPHRRVWSVLRPGWPGTVLRSR
jgi:hypothetical protein